MWVIYLYDSGNLPELQDDIQVALFVGVFSKVIGG